MGVTDWIQPPDEYRARPLTHASGAMLLVSNFGQSEDPPPWWTWPVPAPPIAPQSGWSVTYGNPDSGSNLSYVHDPVADPPAWSSSQVWGVQAWRAGARNLTPVDPPVPTGARVEWETPEGTWADDELLAVVGGLNPAFAVPATTVRVAELPPTWAPTWPEVDLIPLSDWITPQNLLDWPSGTGVRPEQPAGQVGPTVSIAVPYTGDPRMVIATEPAWVEPPILEAVFNSGATIRRDLTVARFRFTPPRYRIHTTGGTWRLRQRQALTATDSWPLRQRQNGGHTGSWPLRQRQRGV